MATFLHKAAEKLISELREYDWHPENDTLNIHFDEKTGVVQATISKNADTAAPTTMAEPAQRVINEQYRVMTEARKRRAPVIFDANDVKWDPGKVEMAHAIFTDASGKTSMIDLRKPKMFDINTPVKLKYANKNKNNRS